MKIIQAFSLLIFVIILFFIVQLIFNILNLDIVKNSVYMNYTNSTYNRATDAFDIFDNTLTGSFVILVVGILFIIIYMVMNGDI